MKQRALNIYHGINLLHIGFYGYLLVRITDMGAAQSLIQGNSLVILLVYMAVYLGLNYLARRIGNGLDNPIRTIRLSSALHYTSVAIFVVGFVLYIRGNSEAFYLMLLSFPLDFFAVVIAYRLSRVSQRSDDLLDNDELGG